MPKRRIDPETGEMALTHREKMLVDAYIANGGNGQQAAIQAGYSANRADQSAYQVLHREVVQQHIRDRIAESHVTPEEIIGSLASWMRGDLSEMLDESGQVDFKLMKQKRLGHLLKTITTTTHEIKATEDKPAQVVRTIRVQLHSPIQAASVLARIQGVDSSFVEPGRTGPSPLSRPLKNIFQKLNPNQCIKGGPKLAHTFPLPPASRLSLSRETNTINTTYS